MNRASQTPLCEMSRETPDNFTPTFPRALVVCPRSKLLVLQESTPVDAALTAFVARGRQHACGGDGRADPSDGRGAEETRT